MKTIFAILSLLAFINLVLSPHLQASEATEPPNQVKIDNFKFIPETLTVAPGTKVTWVNRDDMAHTVASRDKKFKSKAMDTDQSFSFTFTATGTYEYYCSVHPKMTGKIIVK
jgi:plastocyanin